MSYEYGKRSETSETTRTTIHHQQETTQLRSISTEAQIQSRRIRYQ